MIPYAPLLDSQIPAFTLRSNGLPLSVKVNFNHNMAVGYSDVKSMKLIIKELNGTTQINNTLCQGIYTFLANKETVLKKGELEFTSFTGTSLVPGNYYKIQIAYISYDSALQKDVVGSYSSVGIARCIGEPPTIAVNGWTASTAHEDTQTYEGTYANAQGVHEIVYRYRFDLKTKPTKLNETAEILESSGWQFPAGGKMTFTHAQWLPLQTPYALSFTLTTVNGYEQSIEYTISRTGSYNTSGIKNLILKAEQKTLNSQTYGYADVYLDSFIKNNQNHTQLITAKGVLLRQRTSDPITKWEELARFSLRQNSDLRNFAWRDYSVEHGETYIYAIRFYSKSNGVTKWSDMIKSTDSLPETTAARDPLVIQFDHVYLGDADKQLCIQFNPKVSTFKNTILEQKTDTIGGQYPYFFRNGDVKYKEIAISGLISYWMDTIGAFSEAVPELDMRTTQLSNTNFANERKFKLEVMEWLNNGKPKLFRSAAEGNYVVRLMNISLTPNDQIGRMLHNFNATGYEIAANDIKTMVDPSYAVVSFPQATAIPEDQHAVREYVWHQTLGANSIKASVIQPSSRERAKAALQEQTYALIEQQNSTISYDFILRSGVKPGEVNILAALDGLFYDESQKDASGKELTLFNLADLIATYGTSSIPTAAFPSKQLAVALDKVQVVVQNERVNDPGLDRFHHLVTASNQYLFSVEEDETCSTLETDLLYQQNIERLYNLTVTPSANATPDNAWVDIEYEDMTQERIDLSDGIERTYQNLDHIRRIEKGNGVRLNIYALISPNTASSALGAFILDVSTLGGIV